MKRFIKHISIVTVLIFIGGFSYGQLSVNNSTPYNGSPYLIQNVFMGSQISAFNYEYNGTTNGNVTQQVGYFTGGGPLFGIDSGIVMTTGAINSLPSNNFASTSNNGAGDADVLQVANSVGWGTPPSVMRDKAVLEFDFVAPQGDSVAFEYCFGSEEWPIYPCSQYNDAFGFFISGPGINGSYSNNAVNVSVVPGTTALPVAITAIHAGNGNSNSPCQYPSYAQYYNNGPTNTAFAFADLNTGNSQGAYTDVFQTKPIWVNACDTYHVKMAICDGVDRIYDSAVFLKAKSFNFFGISVDPQPSYNPWGFDSALYEGCGSLELFFTRADSVYPPYTLEYKIAGSATMGTDYETVPNCVWNANTNVYDCTCQFAQDSTTVELDIDIYYDQLAEIVETFQFIVTDSNVSLCGSSDTLELTIIDQPVLDVSTFGATTLDCNDPAQLIGVTINNGLPPFTYTWSNTTNGDSTQYVQPAVTSAYAISIEDGCGYQSSTEYITVGVFNVPWAVVKIGDEQTINCTDDPVMLGVGVEFNDQLWHGDISYMWGTGATDSTINVFSLVDTSYSVTITRGCTQESVVKTFNLYVDNDPVITHTEDTDVKDIACPGDPITIGVSASGGYPPYTYLWENLATDTSTVVSPLLTRQYYVSVMDDCGLSTWVDSLTVNVPVADPLVIRGVQNDTVMCSEMKVHFGPGLPSGGFGWGYEISWTDFDSEEAYMQDIIYSDKSYSIKLTDGCHADTAEVVVWGIIAKKNDLDLELSNDTTICVGDAIVLEAQGVNGGGKYKYFWDGSSPTSKNQLAITPLESHTYEVRVVDFCDTVRVKEINVDVSSVNADFEFEYLNDYELALHNKSWSADSVQWYDWSIPAAGVNSADISPVISMPDGNAYDVELMVTNEFGCTDIAKMIVKPDFRLYLPTSFTPNNDGHNETWKMESLGIRELKLELYDRWGNVIFSTTDKDFEWDGYYNGRRVPQGAYAWRIVLFTDNDDFVKREGTVLLMNDFQKR